ncbi:MAG TPA: hypothetical protein PKH83_08305 [Cyclobacteriaceae bacterium]|nr:hypothetical protein [Cyclobacteriaceae bacterium]
MEKEIIWTSQSKNDLLTIYEFNIDVIGEEKAFELIQKIIEKVEILKRLIPGGTRYLSDKRPDLPYQKLIQRLPHYFSHKSKHCLYQ